MFYRVNRPKKAYYKPPSRLHPSGSLWIEIFRGPTWGNRTMSILSRNHISPNVNHPTERRSRYGGFKVVVKIGIMCYNGAL